MNTKLFSLGLVLFLILSTVNSYGQKFDIKKISTNEGLPSGQIGDVVQDEEGYIWLSTYDGLVRYDGIESKVYTTKNGFRNNLIYDIFIDSSERLWISTQETGVAYLHKDSVIYPEYFSVFDTLTVTYITESEDGRLWFSTYGNGLYIWDGKEMEHLGLEEGLPSDIIWYLHFRDNGDTWIATMNGIGIFDGDSIRVIDSNNGLSGTAAYSFAEEKDGTIWVSTSKGITKYNGRSWEQIYEINDKVLGYIYDVFVDKSGLIWIATEQDGIYWFDGEALTHINKKNGLSSNYIFTFNEDNDGRVWVATDENGVIIFRHKNFRMYNSPEFVSGESVNIIHKKGTDFWLGTDNGLTNFREEGNSVHYQIPNDIAQYKEVWDIDELPNGNLLIMNSNSKLIEFDGNNFSDFGISIKLPEVFLHDLLVDGKVIWMATESGLLRYENGVHESFTEADALADNFVWSLYKDHEGIIWATTDEGTNRVESDTITTYSIKDGIAGSSYNLTTQSPDGIFWVGTNTGFTRMVMDENNQPLQIANFSLAEDFLKEPQFLQFDKEGNLWMGTSGGIHFFDHTKLDSAQSGTIDGIFMPLQDFGKGVEMNYLASLQDEKGHLWFGSYTNGLIKYEAGSKPTTQKTPRPFLKNVAVNGEIFEVNDLEDWNLKHDQNNITVEYGAFNFNDPNRVYYEFRLDGFQDNWMKVFGKTEFTYTNLLPGNYNFEIRTKSIQSDWGEAVNLASFQISKPFWQTVWFYFLLLLVFIGISGGILKMMLVYFEKQKLAGLVAERTSELENALGEKDVLIKEIHHRVKNNLAIVSGLLELQSWKIEDKAAKSAIENSKLRIQTMSSIHEKLYQNNNLTEVEFGKFAEDLVSKISNSMRGANKEIKVHLEVEPIKLSVNIAIPCGLILNEALSNSFEHAFNNQNEGNVYISFKEINDNHIQLVIKDDGAGIPEDKLEGKRSSLGLTLIISLANQVKGKVSFLNNKGTTVKLELPKRI
ncbi:MAG: two-component regulator propeller domain-containing protein [Gracilimonas sp.]